MMHLKTTASALVLLLLVVIAIGVWTRPTPRYTLASYGGVVVRLDTRTGKMTACTVRDASTESHAAITCNSDGKEGQ